jgi:GT2 family glycosyltransferase
MPDPRATAAALTSRVAVSVIVPTYERRDSVLRLCTALAAQTEPASEFELLVTVDGSTDGTPEALANITVPYALRTLWQDNRGRGAAINAGLHAATGDLVILLDDDMEPLPSFVTAHRRAHAAAARHGVMGAVPIPLDERSSASARYIAARFNGHLRNLERKDYARRLTDFYSGNFSIPREALLQVGGFDEDFRLYGNEDLELSFRLAKAGIAIAYEPGALALQHHDKSFAALARDSIAEGRTAVLFADKHPEAFDDLKLGTFEQGPRSLRFLRNALLAASRDENGLRDGIVRLEALLSRARPPGMGAFYRLSLGYCYWVGVRAALAERSIEVPDCEGLRRLRLELSS